MRTEDEIFTALEALTATPGFAHTIASICVRENYVMYSDTVGVSEILTTYSQERLIRTEVSTLIGLMVKADIDLALILADPTQIEHSVRETETLLAEMHACLNESARPSFQNLAKLDKNPFESGDVLREAIFYGGESAYPFQYRDIAIEKYRADNPWLRKNKGFSIEEAHAVVRAIYSHQESHVLKTFYAIRAIAQKDRTLLPGFVFSIDDISELARLSPDVTQNVVDAFSLQWEERNAGFNSISDFNQTNAFPIIPLGRSRYLLLQAYSLAESLYESPTYWMLADRAYIDTNAANRGAFVEDFCRYRLAKVFGHHRVHKNVQVIEGKKTLGEIDVLVLFADRALLIQTKAKKLTLESRKGNDNQIRKDFRLAIQDAYDQGFSCAELLLAPGVELVSSDGKALAMRFGLKEIYVLCVVSENYPALAFQSRQFLKVGSRDRVMPPFVLDVFTVDAIAEMLANPLYLLSFINRRVVYADRILATHELTILSYHLKMNLWLDKELSLIQLHDDIGADLDIAMLSRRDGMPGAKTPDGILTRIADSPAGALLRQIENNEHPAPIELGLFLLTLNEDALTEFGNGIETVLRMSRTDGKCHDFSIGVSDASSGVTIHANTDPRHAAQARLYSHCTLRKYIERAAGWFGVCVNPSDGSIRFGLSMQFPWIPSKSMDQVVLERGGSKIQPTRSTKSESPKVSVGRNERCPCGSGSKYKHCCLVRD